MNEVGHSGRAKATALGGLAVILWASTVASVRTLSEGLDVFHGNAIIFLAAGTIAIALAVARQGFVPWIKSLSPGYWLYCGLPFVVNATVLSAAVGLAKPLADGDRTPVLIAGLINYLWPALVLLLSVPIQGNKARWTLWPGALVAVVGVACVNFSTGGVSWDAFKASVLFNALPYALALVAAITWAMYSNYDRIWHARGAGDGVPIFMFLTGVVLAILHVALPERPADWTPKVVAVVTYAALFPTLFAFVFWDIGMRRGNFVVLGVLAYFTPLLSTVISAMFLGVKPSAWLWVGCALVIAGAVACKMSLRERT